MKMQDVTIVLKNKILELNSIPFFKEMHFNADKIHKIKKYDCAYSVSGLFSEICFWIDQFTKKDRFSLCYEIPENISDEEILSITDFPNMWWISNKTDKLNEECFENIIFECDAHEIKGLSGCGGIVNENMKKAFLERSQLGSYRYISFYCKISDEKESVHKFEKQIEVFRKIVNSIKELNSKDFCQEKNKPQMALRKLIDNNKKLWERYELNVNYDFEDGGPKEAMQYIVVRKVFLGKPFEQSFDIELWCDIARDGHKPRFCFSIDLDEVLNKVVAEYAYNEKFPFNLFDSSPHKWKSPWDGKTFFNIIADHKKRLVFDYTGKKINGICYGESFIPSEQEYDLIKEGLNAGNNGFKYFSYYFEENEVENAAKEFFENILPNLKEIGVLSSLKKYTPPETEVKREIEKTAVEIASNYYAENGYSVKSVEKENLGWDLTVVKNEEELHVEVKGTSRNDYHFFLSKKEFEKMNMDSKWRLFVVKDALGNPEHKEILNSDIRDFFDLEAYCVEGSWKTSAGKK